MVSDYSRYDPLELQRTLKQEAHEKAFEQLVLGQRELEQARDKDVREGKQKLQDKFNERLSSL